MNARHDRPKPTHADLRMMRKHGLETWAVLVYAGDELIARGQAWSERGARLWLLRNFPNLKWKG